MAYTVDGLYSQLPRLRRGHVGVHDAVDEGEVVVVLLARRRVLQPPQHQPRARSPSLFFY